MLSRKYRLKKEKDFELVFKKGKTFSSKFLFLKIRKNNFGISRFGFVIGKRITKKSTVRNKIKRRLREVIRKKIEKIKPGFDVVIIGRPEIVDKDYQTIDEAVGKLFKEGRLI